MIVDYKDKRPMMIFEAAKSLKAGDECLAITFCGDECKFAKSIYKAAKLVKRMHSKLKIMYQDSNNGETIIGKTVRIKNDVFPSVIRLTPSSKSIQLILMKSTLSQRLNDTNDMPSHFGFFHFPFLHLELSHLTFGLSLELDFDLGLGVEGWHILALGLDVLLLLAQLCCPALPSCTWRGVWCGVRTCDVIE